MKKIILSLFALSAMFTSCQDAYEIDQPGYVTEESQVFTDNASIKRGINAIYNAIPANTEISFGSIFTDEVGLGHQNGGAGINDGSYNFVLETGNGEVSSIWSTNYNLINRINRMIGAVDNLVLSGGISSAEVSELNKSKAELLVLRAYCNSKLFAYFTPDYTDANGLSVLKLDFIQTDDYSKHLPRATVSEMVSFIESDIALAKELRYDNESYAGQDNTYASKALADAILVNLYSMTEDYQKVVDNANKIIEGGAHSLTDGINFLYMFTDIDLDNNPEIIFRKKLVVTQGGGTANIWFTNRPSASGSVNFDIGRSLYNEIDKLDSSATNMVDDSIRKDIRYKVLVHSDSQVRTNYASLSPQNYTNQDRLLVGKYLGRGQAVMQNDIMLIRFSDVLLSLAEARAALGQITGTVADGNFDNVESIIYNLRKSRINSIETDVTEPTDLPVLTTAQSAWKAILNERRIELAFEGKRYLDVKRLGVKANQGFVRDPQDAVRNSATGLAPNDYKMTMPIPRSEVLSNSNIIQNPGY